MRFVMYKTQGTGRGRAGSQWNRSCPTPAALQPNLLGFSLAVWFVGLSVRRWTSRFRSCLGIPFRGLPAGPLNCQTNQEARACRCAGTAAHVRPNGADHLRETVSAADLFIKLRRPAPFSGSVGFQSSAQVNIGWGRGATLRKCGGQRDLRPAPTSPPPPHTKTWVSARVARGLTDGALMLCPMTHPADNGGNSRAPGKEFVWGRFAVPVGVGRVLPAIYGVSHLQLPAPAPEPPAHGAGPSLHASQRRQGGVCAQCTPGVQSYRPLLCVSPRHHHWTKFEEGTRFAHCLTHKATGKQSPSGEGCADAVPYPCLKE